MEMISLMLARPRPLLPAGVDAVEVLKPKAGAASTAMSFRCRRVDVQVSLQY